MACRRSPWPCHIKTKKMKRREIERIITLAQREKDIKEVIEHMQKKSTTLRVINADIPQPKCLDDVTRVYLDKYLVYFESQLKEELRQIKQELDSL